MDFASSLRAAENRTGGKELLQCLLWRSDLFAKLWNRIELNSVFNM